MTPAEQRDLPLLVAQDAATPEDRTAILDLVVPRLEAWMRGRRAGSIIRGRHGPGVMTTMWFDVDTIRRPERITIRALTHSPEMLVPPGSVLPRSPSMGIDAAHAVHALVLALLDAPMVPSEEHPSSWNRVALSGLRMRESLGLGPVSGGLVDLHHATPLGTGGVHVDAAPEGRSPDGGHADLVDVSPDVCIPGPVPFGFGTVIHKNDGTRHHELVIGGRVRRQILTPLDTMTRMRLERDVPFDASRIIVLPPMIDEEDPA